MNEQVLRFWIEVDGGTNADLEHIGGWLREHYGEDVRPDVLIKIALDGPAAEEFASVVDGIFGDKLRFLGIFPKPTEAQP